MNPRHTISRLLARSGAHEPVDLLAQLSGGERQRAAIARAFATRPKLVVCDEVLSSLDADLRGAILALLLDLQRVHGTSYPFITHDPAVLRELKSSGQKGIHIRP